MGSVHHADPSVHSDPEWQAEETCLLDCLDPCDLEWWAVVSAALDPPAPEPGTDAEWLRDEANDLGDGRGDRYGARALAGSRLCDLVHSLRFHRHGSAAGYLADPGVPDTRADLDNLRLPAVPRRSPLANGLDVLASWYLHLDTDAAGLAALWLLRTAGEAEAWGSDTAEEYMIDSAAWRAAAIDAVCEGRVV